MAQFQLPEKVKSVSTTAGKGLIEVEKFDIAKSKIDVIVGNFSIEPVKQLFMELAGCEIQTTFIIEYYNNPTSTIIITPPGDLLCEALFFVKWLPINDELILQKSTIDLIWTVFQNVIPYNFTSIAFSTVGYKDFACPIDIIIKTMVKEMKNQLIKIDLPWTIKFIVQPDQSDIYDEFCKQILTVQQEPIATAYNPQLPLTWEKSIENQKLFVVSPTYDEYKSIVTNFDQTMRGHYTEIIRIQRVQNERWYMQYMAHSRDFQNRLNTDTEKQLYHGCPEQAAHSIIEGCFNRSYAGINGIALGAGVYFSSSANYSHGYTRPNANGERCMFIARVLVGRTTVGNPSMKTPPPGFDSTSSGHAFVTYHDAQAYAEYLITYK